MRAFWIVLLILVVGGVAFSLSALMGGASAPVAPQTPPPPRAEPRTPTEASTPATTAVEPAKPVLPATSPATGAATPAEPPAAAPTPPLSASPVASPVSVPVEASATTPVPAAKTAPVASPAPATPAAAASAADATPGAEAVGKIGAYEVMAGKVERRADGTTVLDERFTVKGEGTLEKPYEVTWELLTSVDQDFDPHAGKKRIPQRIAFLHEKYVKLGGYIAFPMNMQQPRELLLMLNQWDGCCIGVPPTPYDAIEASLNKTVTGDDRFATVGGVVGKMGIKPYVVGDWLVGLYTMELGDFKPSFGDGGGT